MVSKQELVLGAVWGLLFWVACQAMGGEFEKFTQRGVRLEIANTPAISDGSVSGVSFAHR